MYFVSIQCIVLFLMLTLFCSTNCELKYQKECVKRIMDAFSSLMECQNTCDIEFKTYFGERWYVNKICSLNVSTRTVTCMCCSHKRYTESEQKKLIKTNQTFCECNENCLDKCNAQ